MKVNYEQLASSSKQQSSAKTMQKSLIMLHTAIVIIICQFIIVLLLEIKTHKEMIHNYKLKEHILNLTAHLQSFDSKVSEADNQQRASHYEKSNFLQTKAFLEERLAKAKKRSQTLLKDKERAKHYVERVKSLSPNLSTRSFIYMEEITNCIFVDICYRLTRDGYSAKAFHQKCDGIKPTVVLIYDDSKSIFGGFTHESWDGNGLKYDDKAFLFSIILKNVFHVRKEMPAINASPNLLPTFGKEDIFIDEKTSYINEPLKCYQSKHSSGKDFFHLMDIEVFQMKCDKS